METTHPRSPENGGRVSVGHGDGFLRTARMEKKGSYFALVAAQESSQKAEEAEANQPFGWVDGLPLHRLKRGPCRFFR